MKTIVFLYILTFCSLIPIRGQDTLPVVGETRPVSDTTYVLSLNDTMPKLRCRCISYDNLKLSVVLSRVHSPDTLQLIEEDLYVPEQRYDAKANPIRLIDVNYDGYRDLMITTSQQEILGRQGYSYWLYQPKTGNFERSDTLSLMLNDEPEFNTRDRTVKTSSVGYPNTSNSEIDTYKYVRGTYILIRRLKCETITDLDATGHYQWIYTLEERIAGKLKSTRRQVVSYNQRLPIWARELEER
jgi:hypothetical protein